LKFIYKPEDAAEQTWDFDPAKLHDVEAIEIEKRTGLTYSEFGIQFMKGSILARKALLFVLMKRRAPTLRWEELQFAVGEVDVDFDPVEKRQILVELQKKAAAEGLDPDEQQVMDTYLAEGIGTDADPKSPTADSAEAASRGKNNGSKNNKGDSRKLVALPANGGDATMSAT
jgi:hypothetical protein